jgi:hypothetical protein
MTRPLRLVRRIGVHTRWARPSVKTLPTWLATPTACSASVRASSMRCFRPRVWTGWRRQTRAKVRRAMCIERRRWLA